MNIARKFFKASRMMRDIEVMASGKPAKMLRRQKNKLIGRRLWRLWKFPF